MAINWASTVTVEAGNETGALPVNPGKLMVCSFDVASDIGKTMAITVVLCPVHGVDDHTG